MSDSLNHAIAGLGLPVARQEKVASSDSMTVRLFGWSRICGATGNASEQLLVYKWLTIERAQRITINYLISFSVII